jgi:hypothetical protein
MPYTAKNKKTTRYNTFTTVKKIYWKNNRNKYKEPESDKVICLVPMKMKLL